MSRVLYLNSVDLLSLTPASLTELLKLVEEKQFLNQKIVQIDEAMERLFNGREKLSLPTSVNRQSKRIPRSKMKRGQLGSLTLEILKKAGEGGVTVTEIAKTLGVDSIKVHAWFATTGKRTHGVSRIAKARYALVSNASAAVDAIPAMQPV